ncbi:MAG: vWA domain-containing protein [Methylotetracoccus sp.]
MSIGFEHPGWLFGALAMVLPWISRSHPPLRYSSLLLVPDDPVSDRAERALTVAGSLGLLSLAIAAAGPYGPEREVERIGRGAEIVLLIDRSSSMSENFTGRYLSGSGKETKSFVARQVLSDFVARRENDLIGIVSFSAAPVYVLPLTNDKPAVLAAINGSADRGHGVTNIASGLIMALDYFAGRPQTGTRIVLLVSDGAARIDDETRARIRQDFSETRAHLYWLYLRGRSGVRLDERPANAGESTTPEYFLHEFFKSLGTPYSAYEADNAEAFERAVAEVGRRENEPLTYRERLPRSDLSTYALAAALLCLLPVLISRAMETGRWNE